MPDFPATDPLFLSTLSLRRATRYKKHRLQRNFNFYPRSPCGERLAFSFAFLYSTTISIHALLAESDILGRVEVVQRTLFLSTLSLRRATLSPCRIRPLMSYFYPRSPCGERRKSTKFADQKLVFLSTLSLRRATILKVYGYGENKFLSTLSLRRATS